MKQIRTRADDTSRPVRSMWVASEEAEVTGLRVTPGLLHCPFQSFAATEGQCGIDKVGPARDCLLRLYPIVQEQSLKNRGALLCLRVRPCCFQLVPQTSTLHKTCWIYGRRPELEWLVLYSTSRRATGLMVSLIFTRKMFIFKHSVLDSCTYDKTPGL